MMKAFLVFVLFAGVMFNSYAAEDVLCDQQCKLTQVKRYFDNLQRISKKGSTAEDIERLLAAVHDDVKYEHIEYQANFTKSSWRKAFLRQLKLGSYDSGPEDELRILNSINGKSHMAVEYSYGKKRKDGSWQAGDLYFALFGFKDGKLALIREYW